MWLINSAAATAGCYAVDGSVSALLAYAQPIELPEDDAVAGCKLFATSNSMSASLPSALEADLDPPAPASPAPPPAQGQAHAAAAGGATTVKSEVRLKARDDTSPSDRESAREHRCGSLLLSVSAYVRCASDDVIAFEGRSESEVLGSVWVLVGGKH